MHQSRIIQPGNELKGWLLLFKITLRKYCRFESLWYPAFPNSHRMTDGDLFLKTLTPGQSVAVTIRRGDQELAVELVVDAR